MTYRDFNQRFLDISVRRLRCVVLLIFVFSAGIILRLFFLQVIESEKFLAIAERQHLGGITIPARRGEILSEDLNNNIFFKLATNITLDLLYIDPKETPDKAYVAKILAPLIFTEEDYTNCQENAKLCPSGITVNFNESNINEKSSNKNETAGAEEKTLSRAEIIDKLEKQILEKITPTEVTWSLLKKNISPEILNRVQNLAIPGIIVDQEQSLIAANPILIPQNDITRLSRILERFLEISYQDIAPKLERREIRYVPLKRKLNPEISAEIKKLQKESLDTGKNELLKGVVLLPEHWRYYPNDSLAASILGFYNNQVGGQYGLEEFFNIDLIGRQGEIKTDTDPSGNAISFGEQDFKSVINGKNFVLTLDIPIQKKVEEVLQKRVAEFKAVSGQIIIMNPFTGAILSLATAPTFNPNNYGEVFDREKVAKWENIPKYLPVMIKENNTFRLAQKEERNDYNLDRYIYKNLIGPEVYRNKTIQDIYEPGSVFKPIVMSIALDRNEVTPETIFLDKGPIKTGDFLGDKEIEIHNANDKVYGLVTMTECLEKSINTCLSFVAKKLGKKFYAPLFYNYIKDFGFGEYTDIELTGEEKGKILFWDQWSETQLLTTSFGQGIAATPLQVITAWCALANGGLLVKPHIIAGVFDTQNEYVPAETKIIRRVISKSTSSTISSMLVSVVNNGSKKAYIPGYKIAGKTGTSEIANESGNGYEKGEGSNITSFVGFAPAYNPKFVILVKFDRPRFGTSDTTWGESTAAPTFKEIAEFLFDYYNLPPENQ